MFASAALMLSTVSMTLAPGCLKTSSITAVWSRCSAPSVTSCGPSIGLADVADANRRAVAIGDDDVVIGTGLRQLIVVDDGEALLLAEHRALGGIGRGAQQRGAHVFQRQTAGGQFGRIDLHADCRALLTADGDERHAGDLRNLRGDDVLGEIIHLRQRNRASRSPPRSGSASWPGSPSYRSADWSGFSAGMGPRP